MRPLELTIEGFRSYRDPYTFSFDERTLFGIVGPIGSGKSTILEAMIYALYGKTPRIGSATTKLITSGHPEARVRLLFEARDSVWEVTRVLRRKGGSQVTLHPPGDRSSPITGESAVNAKIEELIGLDFEAFRSTVLLPQGDFGRFLGATASERSRILKGIFRLERVDAMREAAKMRLGAANAELSGLTHLLDTLPEDPETELSKLRVAASASATHAEAVKAALPQVTAAENAISTASERVSEIDSLMRTIEQVVSQIPEAERLEAVTEAEGAMTRRLEKAMGGLESARTEVTKAEAAHAEAETSLGGAEWLADVRSGLRDRERLRAEVNDWKSKTDTAKREETELLVRVESAGTELATAEAAHGAARDELHAAHLANASHLLRETLVPGESCPVCEQVVSDLPSTAAAPAISKAQKALDAAEREVKKARAQLDAARSELGVKAGVSQSVQASLADAEAQLSKVEATLLELCGEADPASELKHRETELAKLTKAVAGARSLAAGAEIEERSAREALTEIASERRGFEKTLDRICGQLGLDATLAEDGGVAAVAKRAADAASAQLAGLVRSRSEVIEHTAAAHRTLEEFRERFHSSEREAVAEVLARAVAAVRDAERDVAEMEALIEKKAEVESRSKELLVRRALLERVATDLTDSKFIAYLLEERRRVLSRLGSDKLLELTQHYRFDDEGKFEIIDERSGSQRTADTLSGGETFLASLALALALAEAVSLDGGVLRCFFLDEGFGSLDAESLDLALEGIQALATPGRLIGLVSHVPGMQAALEDLIVLERGVDGTTVVVQVEGPLAFATPSI